MDSKCLVDGMCNGPGQLLCDSTIDHLIDFEPFDSKSFNMFQEIIDISSVNTLLTSEPILEQFSNEANEPIVSQFVTNAESILNQFVAKTTDEPIIAQYMAKEDNDTSLMKSTSIEMCNKFNVNRSEFISQSKLEKICQQIVQKMNSLGMCVINNFMDDIAPIIHNEVINLFNTTAFSFGQLLLNENTIRTIRGDLIYWVNGSEDNCKHIHELIKMFDLIVFNCNKMVNNGLMGVYDISSRTPAMVACYPGRGARFMKHADNYSGDGRCITCIYYANKDWDYSRDGGCLRVYPTQMKIDLPYVDIEPVLDRLVFFWSDRRNLHEVLPSNRFRFAITVWYFDDEERKRYKHNFLTDI